MFKIEKGKPFYFSLITLIYTFNIPKNSEQIHFASFWFIYSVLKLLCFLVSVASPIVHAVLSIKNETGIDVSEDIAVTIGYGGAIAVCILFTQNYNRWMDFFGEVTFFDGVGDVSIIFEKHNRRCNLIIAYFGFCLGGIIFWAIVHLSQFSSCQQLNQEKDLHEICGAFHAIWLPVADVNGIQLILIIVVQLFIAVSVLSTAAIISCVLWESTLLLTEHMDILKEHIKNLFEEPAEVSDRVRFCIVYHVRILSMANRLNKLSKNTQSELAPVGTAAMGVIMNQMLRSTSGLFAGFLFLVGYTAATFFLCYSGELIKNETLSIADAIWATSWEKANPETMKDLSFMLFRSQKPICFEALPFGILDYPLFVAILKTSYTYLTMLNRTM